MSSQHSVNYQIFRHQTELERIGFALKADAKIKQKDREYLSSALIRIARKADAKIKQKDREYLSSALIRIARGEDPRAVFGIRAARGKRTSFSERNKIASLQLVLGWISTAIEPVQLDENGDQVGGLGLTLETACARAAELFPGRTEETLRNEWATRPEMRGINNQHFKWFLSHQVCPT